MSVLVLVVAAAVAAVAVAVLAAVLAADVDLARLAYLAPVAAPVVAVAGAQEEWGPA